MANINYEFVRRNMVTNQLRPNKIQDERLLDRVLEVPREIFLPKDDRWKAYIDQYISLGNDRYLFQPIAVAQLPFPMPILKPIWWAIPSSIPMETEK